MVNTIHIKKIVNGYTSTSEWSESPNSTVYHTNLDECFKHLTEVFSNDKKFSSQVVYNDGK